MCLYLLTLSITFTHTIKRELHTLICIPMLSYFFIVVIFAFFPNNKIQTSYFLNNFCVLWRKLCDIVTNNEKKEINNNKNIKNNMQKEKKQKTFLHWIYWLQIKNSIWFDLYLCTCVCRFLWVRYVGWHSFISFCTARIPRHSMMHHLLHMELLLLVLLHLSLLLLALSG